MESTKMSGHRWKPINRFCATVLVTFTLLNSGLTAPSDSAEGLTLKYEPGKTYTYEYETTSVIKLLGTSDEQSQVQLKGYVHLTPSTKNDFVLTLGDFVLDVTSPNEKLASPVSPLKGSSSRFTTDAGVIQNFYVKGDESPWVANYHRAIVSAFNNYALKDSQQAFYLENDISGSDCPTEYKIKSDGSYHKSRDLNKCKNRDGGYTEQYGVPYATDSDEATSDTSIRSSQECIQKYANGLLTNVDCSEVHRVTLLSPGKDTGGNAHVTTKLRYQSILAASPVGSIPSKLSSILFDHAGTDLTSPANANEIIEGLVGKLCLSTGNNGRLSSDTAAVFLTLKAKIRFASKQVLEAVYNKLKGGQMCEVKGAELNTLVKLYVDAVLMAGSSESIAFGAQLVNEGVVSKNSAKRFRIYTAFANRPGEAALKSVLSLLDGVKDTTRAGGPLDAKYLLTASGIAYQFCLTSKTDCATNKAYTSLVKKIAELTTSKCQGATDNDKAQDAVIALQALGNLNKLTPEAVDSIKTCLTGQSERIKLHALQAIRRDPCQYPIRLEARNILKNSANPAHLRISAYLTLTQCYAAEDSFAIRSFIKTEESIQVLSFIKSHRENAWSQSARDKDIDGDLFYGVNFDKLQSDIRKFSSSLAFSDDLDDYSANVIYSDDSFLPKIVYSNTSAKLFGQDFGLLEFGAHLGGLEQDAMEKAFGENPSRFWEDARRRPRRQSGLGGPTLNQNEIDTFHAKVRVPQRKTVPSDIYLRVFGTTVYATSFTMDDLALRKLSRQDYLTDLFDRVLKGEEVQFTEAYPLYGDELIIPTVSGLSLWIQNEGAAIFSLKFSYTGSENMVTFNPKISPGISTANNMKLTIAGEIIEAGLRAETTAAASTDISVTGKLSATDEQYGCEVRIAMPANEVKLVEFSNELFWILQSRHVDYDLKQKMTTKNSPVVDTGVLCTKYLQIVTGIKKCFQAQLPPAAGRKIPSFPLSGPAKVKLTLSPPAGARELVLKFTASKPEAGGLVAEIDAPGATENIKSVFKTNLVTESGYEKFTLDLDSPKLKAGFSSSRAVEIPGVRDLTLKVYRDDQHYSVNFKRQESEDTATQVESKSYAISYTWPKQREVEVFSLDMSEAIPGSNKIYRSLAVKVNDFSLGNPEVKPFVAYSVVFDGTMGNTPGQVLKANSQLSLYGKKVFSFKGSGKTLTETTVYLDLDGTINIAGKDEDINIKGELSGLGVGGQPTKKGFKGTTKSVSRPVLNGDIEVSVDKPEPNLWKNIFIIKSPKFAMSVAENIDMRDGKFKMNYDGKVFCQELQINKEKKYEVEFTPEKVLVDFRYASDEKTVADVKFNLNRLTKAYDTEILFFISGKKNLFKSKNTQTGDRLVFEHSAEVEGKFTGSVKTEIFDSKDNEGSWKNRETTLTSDAFPDAYAFKVKYNVDAIFLKAIRGSQEMAAFSVSNKVDQDWTHNCLIDISAEKLIVASVGVRCNSKQERVEIVSSVTQPPHTGPQRVAKLVLVGKGANDQPGEKTFGVSFDLKMDAGKDPQSTFALTNDNKWKQSAGGFSLESTNGIVVKGKSRTANFKVNGEQQPEAQTLSLTFDHVSPDGKADKLEVSALHEYPHGKVMGTLKFEGFGEGGTLQVGLQNINAVHNVGDFVAKYTCLKKGKIFDISVSTHKSATGRTFSSSVSGFGQVIEGGIQQDVSVETGAGKHSLNFLGKYAKRAIYLKSNLEKIKGTTLKKIIFDLDFDRNYQKENGAALTTKTTFAYRYNTVSDFELQSTGQYELKRDGKFVHSFSRKVKASPGSLNVESKSTFQYGDNAPEKSELNLNLENSDKKVVVVVDLESKVLALISGSENVQPRIDFDFETTKNIDDLQFLLSLKLPTDKFQSGSLNIKRTVAGATRTSKVTGKLNQEQVDIEASVYLTEAKKTADISLKLNNETPKKLSLKYDTAGGHVAEATYKWGDNGQVLTSKGSMTKDANDGFTAKFEFDVPAMNQQWNLEVARQVTATKKSTSFVATSTRSKQHIKFTGTQEHTQKSAYSGSLNIDLAAPNDKYDFDGTLQLVLDKSQPAKSLLFKLDYVVGEDKRSRSVALDTAVSPDEKHIIAKLSLTPENTFQLKSTLKTQELENSFEFSLTNPSHGLDATASAGLTLSADRKTRLTSVKYSLAHSSLKGKKELGISLYKKPGTGNDLELTKSEISSAPSTVSTRGFELTLPERTYGAHIVHADWSDADARAGELNLWFDKKAAPNQKLTIGYACSKPSVEEEQGGDFAFIIRHHKLQKDLRLKSRYRYNASSSKIFEARIDLDVFKRQEDKLSFKVELNHDVNSDNYTFVHGLYSDGLGMVMESRCEGITIDFPRYTSICTITHKHPNIAPIKYKAVTNIYVREGYEVKSLFQVYNGDERIFHFKRSVDLSDESQISVRSQLQLPGMTDIRNINARLVRKPFRLTLSTNPSSSKDVTGFWIGATSVQGGGFGLSRTDEAGEKKDLVAFSANVQSKKLKIDFDWSKENIAAYLAYLVRRGLEIEKSAVKTCDQVNKQEWEARQSSRKTLRAASQDFEPILQWYETQLTQIGSKYGAEPVKFPRGSILRDEAAPGPSRFVAKLKAANKCLQENADSINAFLDSISKKPTLPTPEAVKERSKAVREFVERVAGKIRKVLGETKELKEKFPILKKPAKKLREKVVAKLQAVVDEISDDLNEMYPYAEVSHFLEHFRNYFETALLEPEKISEEDKTEMLGDVEKAVEKILSKTYSINFAEGRIRAEIPLLSKLGSQGRYGADHFGKANSECVKELYDSPRSILPPVNATAFIVGSSNYVTFDGTEGAFDKLCPFILASDFVNKKFTVALNLEGSQDTYGLYSTLFVTDHKTTVGIQRGLMQVSINGKSSRVEDTPVRSGAFVVYRDASFVIVEGDMGITVGCSDAFGVCAVQVSGFYHGKLQGVLGKYNNNPYDDLTLPTGQLSTNDASFQASWKLNSQCGGRVSTLGLGDTAAVLPGLYKSLKQKSLDIDNFFSRSSSAPYKAFYQKYAAVASAPSASPLTFISILFSTLLALILARLN